PVQRRRPNRCQQAPGGQRQQKPLPSQKLPPIDFHLPSFWCPSLVQNLSKKHIVKKCRVVCFAATRCAAPSSRPPRAPSKSLQNMCEWWWLDSESGTKDRKHIHRIDRVYG